MARLLSFFRSRGLNFWIISGVVLIILILLLSFFWSVKVRTGTRIICRYGEVIKDDTKVVYRPRAWADNYQYSTKKIVCEKHLKAEKLYEQAQKLLAKGDLKGAQQALSQIIELDPNYKKTKTQLAGTKKAIEASGGSSGTGSSSDSSGTNGGGNEYPEIDIKYLFPDPLPGYFSGNIQDNGDGSFSRTYTPKSPQEQEIVQSVLIAIHQWPNDKYAREFVVKSKLAFPENAKNLSLNGNFAYSGTDTNTYSYIAWYERNLAFEIAMHSAQGKPKTLSSRVMDIANLF